MFYIVRLIDDTVIDFEGKCTSYEEAGNFVQFRDENDMVLGCVNSDCVKYIIDDDCLDSIQEASDDEDDA